MVQPSVTEPQVLATPLRRTGPHTDSHPAVERPDALRIAIVAIAAALVWFHVWEPFAKVSVLGVLGTVIVIYPILKEAAAVNVAEDSPFVHQCRPDSG